VAAFRANVTHVAEFHREIHSLLRELALGWLFGDLEEVLDARSEIGR